MMQPRTSRFEFEVAILILFSRWNIDPAGSDMNPHTCAENAIVVSGIVNQFRSQLEIGHIAGRIA